MPPVSVLLIDDHPIFLEGLRRVLEAESDVQVVGAAHTVAGAVEQAGTLRPEIVLLDLGLKDGSGLDALPRILEAHPRARVIVLSGYGPENIMPALRLGARGFVSKDNASSHLIRAVRAVLRGEVWAERQATGQLVDEMLQRQRQQAATEALTPREREVLRCVGEGKRNNEIARALSISENTVKTHVASLMRKLAIDDRLQLALYASRGEETRR